MSATTATKLHTIDVRSKVIKLAMAGKRYEDIAEEVGLAGKSSVAYHVKAWSEETKPSAELTDEFRKLQLARLEAMHEKLWPHLEVGGEPNLPVVDRLLRVAERASKLMGSDLQQNVNVNVLPSQEELARLFGWVSEPAAIEGTATEVTD